MGDAGGQKATGTDYYPFFGTPPDDHYGSCLAAEAGFDEIYVANMGPTRSA